MQIKNIFKSWQYFPLSLTIFFISKWRFVQAYGYLEKQSSSTACCSTSHILLVLLSLHAKCCHRDYFLFPCFDNNGFIFATADSEMSEDSHGPSEWNPSLSIISCYQAIDPNSDRDTCLCYPVKEISIRQSDFLPRGSHFWAKFVHNTCEATT